MSRAKSRFDPGRREGGGSPDERKTTTMEERLNKMRIEDRRRMMNELARNSASSSRTKLDARAPAFEPYSQSASARAGTLYYVSSTLREQDAMKSQRQHALRRKFAGPTPPSSWQPEESETAHEAIDSEAERAKKRLYEQRLRCNALTASRQFSAEDEEWRANHSGMPQSLVDLCLCKISRHLSYVCQGRQVEGDRISTVVRSIPLHLKERLMALSGRLMMAPPLSERSVELLFSSMGDPIDELRIATSNSAKDDEDDLDELLDSWDSQSTEEDDVRIDSAACHFVDLSYASVTSRSVRSLLLDSCIRPDSIRALSLAGWGNGKSGAMGVNLRSSTALLNALDKLNNLRFLSLADSRLLNERSSSTTDGLSQGDDGVRSHLLVSEAIAFLKKLSRRTVRLETLDLSCCAWVDGAVIANVGWYATSVPIRRLAWPHMKVLVLAGCPALMPEGTKIAEQSTIDFTQSQAFVGSWHAAHHGVARVTKSPYFLSHRPGLGRAVLADGVGAWDSASGRGTLVERQAAALTDHRRSQRSAQTVRTLSAFDDEQDVTNDTFAISHGVAPFASRQIRGTLTDRQGNLIGQAKAEELKPRCPVSTSRVEHHEWARARILDAVHGRWGSAIVGHVLENNSARQGTYIAVYF